MVIKVEEKAVANVEARLDDLESKVTFQENTIQKLNEVVIAQEARIHDLETSLRLLLESLRNQASPGIEPVENPPPHY